MATSKYFRQVYVPRIRPRMAAQGGGLGQGISSLGRGASGLIGTISNAIAQAKQNDVANQILNTVLPPRAAYVGGAAPKAGTNLYGSAPHTGGAAEIGLQEKGLQLAQEVAKARMAEQLGPLRVAAAQQNVGGRSPWARGGSGGGGNASRAIQRAQQPPLVKGQKAAPYQYSPDNPVGDNTKAITADANAALGSGGYNKVLQAAGAISKDPKTGQFVSNNPNIQVDGKTGDITFGKTGKDADGNPTFVPSLKLPAAAAATFRNRLNAVQVQNGQDPQYGQDTYTSAHPETGSKAGTPENPFTPTSVGELSSLPPGSWAVNPQDGKPYQVQPPHQRTGAAAVQPPTQAAKAAAPTAETTTEEGSMVPPDTSTESTGDESDTGGETTSAVPSTQGRSIGGNSDLATTILQNKVGSQIAGSDQSGAQQQAQSNFTGQSAAPVLPEEVARAQVADALMAGDQTDALKRALLQMPPTTTQGSVYA